MLAAKLLQGSRATVVNIHPQHGSRSDSSDLGLLWDVSACAELRRGVASGGVWPPPGPVAQIQIVETAQSARSHFLSAPPLQR